VRCTGCGHLYNAGFEPDRADELYGAFVLTNAPVSLSMMTALEDTARYILGHAKKRPAILEIGGGVGALSLLLAKTAPDVHLVEPSLALTADRFAGTKVTFHHSMFPAPSLGNRRFDVIISRQVLEHVPEPAPFLAALRRQLAPDGIAYIEVPRAEYIYGSHSIVDFHYPHVHYYRREELETLFQRAGFRIDDVLDVKDGHDVAFLVRPVPEADKRIMQAPGTSDRFAATLEARRALGRKRLGAFTGPIGLYGANAYSQALFGLYPEVPQFKAMFDDTPQYADQFAYGPRDALPIGPPSTEKLRTLDAIIITAYLHDVVIARKVRGLGFTRPIYTVRSDETAGRGDVPPSLFSDGPAAA
jgi:SAM-dependent methyltransferase